MSTFRQADKAVAALVTRTANKYHPRLAQVGVTFNVLMAHAPRDKDSDEPKGPAIKKDGIPCAATIKITSQKDRAAGLADAVLVLDGDEWDTWPEEKQIATIDHELTHLLLKKEDGKISDDGQGVALDDCNRPKMKIRPHDAQLGVFFEVMDRHGAHAFDTQLAAKLCEDARQYIQPLLTWG